MKTLKVTAIAFLALLFLICTAFTPPKVTTDKNSVVKVHIAIQKDGVIKNIDTTFYGKCDDQVNDYIKSWSPSIEDKPEIENKKTIQKETKVVRLENDAPASNPPTGNYSVFEEQTKAFYGNRYEALDKTKITVTYYKKGKAGLLTQKDITESIIITDNDASWDPMDEVMKRMNENSTEGELSLLDSTITDKKGQVSKVQVIKIKKEIKNNDEQQLSGKAPENLSDEKPVNTLKIYPNPGKGIININFSVNEKQDIVIDIADITGKKVFSQQLNGYNGTYANTLDFSKYSKGIYTITISGKDSVLESEKFILE